MNSFSELAFAYDEPPFSADFRSDIEDFIVAEDLGFELCGEGEHLCLQIEKRGENTHWVAENIARQLGIKVLDVSYCGKKDRYAITSQWFSAYLPKREVEPALLHKLGSLNPDGTCASTKLLNHSRHKKKLRRGEHEGNDFRIRLRNISAKARLDIDPRLQNIRDLGVPNYFGEQRFGREGNNLQLFDDMFVSKKAKLRRNQKSMLLSAARSHLFNLVLSARVRDGSWRSVETGPLWGRGELSGTEIEKHYETNALLAWQQWRDALEHVGLFQERRQLVLLPRSLQWQWAAEDILDVAFSLSSGEFATVVLREIVSLNNVQHLT
ncbi:MAG: tRNA pseudouridine(13) synthase TruD [Cellvibrionaceae bacterium]|nr:tRNA pseudouridine(13) synthase TruD [Cellvibrionaceae bacterium]